MKALFLVLLAFTMFTAPASAADPEPAAIDELVNDTLQAWGAPGMVVVVVRGEEILLLKGYGRKQFDRPEAMTPDTVFPLASCTKMFTSTVMATQVDESELRWDDPVSKHLPAFHLSEPHADALVSLRDVLSHRTGLATHDLLWYRSAWDTDELLKRIAKLPLDYPFRGGYAYSSLMYIVAGQASANRAGEPWEKLVKSRLTDPLGMKTTYFTTRSVPTGDLATGHQRDRNGKLSLAEPYDFAEPNSAGSMYASGRDVAKWLRFQLAGGKTPDGTRLVSEKNLLETRRPQSIIPLTGANREQNPDTSLMCYGMGWVLYDYRGQSLAAHGGIVDGFRIQLTLVPEQRLAFAVLTNLYDSRITQAVSNTLIDRYCHLPARDWNAFFLKFRTEADASAKARLAARDKARNPDRKPSLPLASYSGTYAHPSYGTAKVMLTDSNLTLAWSSFTCKLEQFDGNYFRIPSGFFEEQLVEFTVNAGNVTTLHFTDVQFEKQ